MKTAKSVHKAFYNGKVKNILFAAFWIAIWQFASISLQKEFLLASPWNVLKTLSVLVFQTDFWLTVGFSLIRILVGFFFAVMIGTLLSVASYRFHIIAELIRPMMLLIKSTPVASFIILILLWVNSQLLSPIIAFLMALPVIYANTYQGLLTTDKKLLEMARVFRVKSWSKTLYIYFDHLVPYFSTGCALALGLAWKSGIAAEVIGIPNGSIGERLYQAKIYLNSSELLAWTAVIIILSYLAEKVFVYCLQRVVRTVNKCV